MYHYYGHLFQLNACWFNNSSWAPVCKQTLLCTQRQLQLTCKKSLLHREAAEGDFLIENVTYRPLMAGSNNAAI